MSSAAASRDACTRSKIRESSVQPAAKELVRELLDRLSDDCSLSDVLYHLYIVQGARQDLADAAVERTSSHEQVASTLRHRHFETGV